LRISGGGVVGVKAGGETGESEGRIRGGGVRGVDAKGADCSPQPLYHRPNLLSEGRKGLTCQL
jgi:hypothetical protein